MSDEQSRPRTVLVIQGPNLNRLGLRRPEKYGTTTLQDIEALLDREADTLGARLLHRQSNHEGELIDFVHEHQDRADGIIINPAGLFVNGHVLADAVSDTALPCAVVHLSCMDKYEGGRREDLFRFVGDAYVAGMGPAGYVYALRALMDGLKHVPFWGTWGNVPSK